MILAQGAKQDTPLSRSKPVACDNGRRDTLAAGPLAGTTPVPPEPKKTDVHDPRLRPTDNPFAESRGLQAKTRGQPHILIAISWLRAIE